LETWDWFKISFSEHIILPSSLIGLPESNWGENQIGRGTS
jgi:hypothetical protein